MKFKFGSKQISMPSARLPNMKLPQWRMVSALHLPIPTRFRFGGAKAGLASLGVVAIGFAATLFLIIATTNSEMLWPEAGAEYTLPNVVGLELPLLEDGSEDQTLAVVLAAGTRLENLSLNMDMGRTGADCIAVERASGTSGYLFADAWIMDGLIAPTLVLSNSEIHHLVLTGNTDGHHTGPTQDSSIPDITIGSLYGASTYQAEGRVDKVVITLLGDAVIKTVHITGKCSTGPVDLDYLKVGQLSLLDVRIGDDGVLTTAAVDIDSSTKIYSISDSFVDKPIIVK